MNEIIEKEILKQFTRLESFIRGVNELDYYDDNRRMESIVCDLLEIVGYDEEIKNLNEVAKNYPGIDLEGKSSYYQVTSQDSIKKVRDTLKKVKSLADYDSSKAVVMFFLQVTTGARFSRNVKDEGAVKLDFTDLINCARKNNTLNSLRAYLDDKFEGRYLTIDQVEEEIQAKKKGNIDIDLNFFKCNDKKFDNEIRKFIDDAEEQCLYVLGQDIEEAKYITLATLKEVLSEDEITNIGVYNSEEEVNKLSWLIEKRIIVSDSSFEAEGVKRIIILSPEEDVEGVNKIKAPKTSLHYKITKLREAKVDGKDLNIIRDNSCNSYNMIKRHIFKRVEKKPKFIMDYRFLKEGNLIFKMFIIGKFSFVDFFNDVKVIDKLLEADYKKVKEILGEEYRLYFREFKKTKIFTSVDRIRMIQLMMDEIDPKVGDEIFSFFRTVLLNEHYFDYIVGGIAHYSGKKEGVLSNELYESVLLTLQYLKYEIQIDNRFRINERIDDLLTEIINSENCYILIKFFQEIHLYIELNPKLILSEIKNRIQEDQEFKKMVLTKISYNILRKKEELLYELVIVSEKLLYTNEYGVCLEFLLGLYVGEEGIKRDYIKDIISGFLCFKSTWYNVQMMEKCNLLINIKDDKELYYDVLKYSLNRSGVTRLITSSTYLPENEFLSVKKRDYIEMLKKYYLLFLESDIDANDYNILFIDHFVAYDIELIHDFEKHIKEKKMTDREIFSFKASIRNNIVNFEKFKDAWEIKQDKIEQLYEFYELKEYKNNGLKVLETCTSMEEQLTSKESTLNELDNVAEYRIKLIEDVSVKEIIEGLMDIGDLDVIGYSSLRSLGESLAAQENVSLSKILPFIDTKKEVSAKLVSIYVRSSVYRGKESNLEIVKLLIEYVGDLSNICQYVSSMPMDRTFMNIDKEIRDIIFFDMEIYIENSIFERKDYETVFNEYCMNGSVEEIIKIISDNYYQEKEKNYDRITDILMEINLNEAKDRSRIEMNSFLHILEGLVRNVQGRDDEVGEVLYKFLPVTKRNYMIERELLNKVAKYLFKNPNNLVDLTKAFNEGTAENKPDQSYFGFVYPIFGSSCNIFVGASVDEIRNFKDVLFSKLGEEYENDAQRIMCGYLASLLFTNCLEEGNISKINNYEELYQELTESEIRSTSIYFQNHNNGYSEHIATPNRIQKSRIEIYKEVCRDIRDSSPVCARIIGSAIEDIEYDISKSEEENDIR